MIITGHVNPEAVFKALAPLEEKIISKVCIVIKRGIRGATWFEGVGARCYLLGKKIRGRKECRAKGRRSEVLFSGM